MQRRIAIGLVIGLITAVGSYADCQEQGVTNKPSRIGLLQRKRIELLQQRVTELKAAVDLGLVDSARLARSKIDLLNAQLDYANTPAEERTHLTGLLTEYDKLIDVARATLYAPALLPRPGEDNQQRLASSELLFLQSERVRIEILRESLD